MSGELLIAEVAAANVHGQGEGALALMTASPVMRAALQLVYDEMGKQSRWNVSTLRLDVLRPLLAGDVPAALRGLEVLAKAAAKGK